MITDEKYQTYASCVASNVPRDHLMHIVNVMVEDAALNMGSRYDQKAVDRIIEFVEGPDYKDLPLAVVASAFARGSLGKFGPGRLVPKTVHDWLDISAEEHRRYREHKQREDRMKENHVAFDLKKYPVGAAIIKKMDWLKSGAIHINDWDGIPLKELAERISQGVDSAPELWGIKTKNR